MNHLIREAEYDDFSGIQALNAELFLFETSFSQEYDVWWMYTPKGVDYFARRLVNEDGNSILLVAENEGKLIGYICGYVESNSARNVNKIAEVENMLVEDTFQNQGIGKSLMDMFLEKASKLGAKKARVGFFVGNRKAENFYRKMEFFDHELMLERKIS